MSESVNGGGVTVLVEDVNDNNDAFAMNHSHSELLKTPTLNELLPGGDVVPEKRTRKMVGVFGCCCL